MKLTKISNLILLGLALTLISTGCKKKPVNVTNLPNGRTSTRPPGGLDPAVPFTPAFDPTAGLNSTNTSGIAFDPNAPSHTGWTEAPEALASETRYFACA